MHGKGGVKWKNNEKYGILSCVQIEISSLVIERRNPMRDILDLHTHTIASGHAYSTIETMIDTARGKDLELYAITEHAPKMPGTCSLIYFQNLKVIPREREDITVLFGTELNILDSEGHVDMDEETLSKMDVVIASVHMMDWFQMGSREENTRTYINVMKNPYVNIIGHPDDRRFPIEYRPIVEAAKENRILLEVNNSSLGPGSSRGNPVEAYYEMLELCKEYEQPIVMGSDAHVDIDVANHSKIYPILEHVNFPEELIMNTSVDKIKKYLNYYKRQ